MTSNKEGPLVAAFTLALWTGSLTIGVIGLKVSYPRARAPAPEPSPVAARFMEGETIRQMVMTPRDGVAPPQPAARDENLSSPPPPEVAVVPPAPQLTAVATPSPAIAYAVPVAGPTRIVPVQAAIPPARPPVPVKTAAPAPIAQPAVRHITFGEGDGQQPPPEYPREAAMQRQEGTVVVRFTVGEDGRVTSAYAVTPSSWPLLNQAAVRAVRETWQFNAGDRRTYEVPISFQLAP